MSAASTDPLRIAVSGIFGRVGTTVANAVAREDDLTLVGGVDIIAADEGFTAANGQTIATETELSQLLAQAEPDVIIDFTRADAARREYTRGPGSTAYMAWLAPPAWRSPRSRSWVSWLPPTALG